MRVSDCIIGTKVAIDNIHPNAKVKVLTGCEIVGEPFKVARNCYKVAVKDDTGRVHEVPISRVVERK
jgi:hypothetical protein